MTATIGHTSILLALILALAGIIIPIIGSGARSERYVVYARASILGQFFFVTVAALSLIYGLITTDFSIRYVAFNTTRATAITLFASKASMACSNPRISGSMQLSGFFTAQRTWASSRRLSNFFRRSKRPLDVPFIAAV
jgi:cytochrome c-type biogenesis protein CcmF